MPTRHVYSTTCLASSSFLSELHPECGNPRDATNRYDFSELGHYKETHYRYHVPHMKADIAWLKVLQGATFAAILALLGIVIRNGG